MKDWLIKHFYVVMILYVLAIINLIYGSFFIFGRIFLKLEGDTVPVVTELPVGYKEFEKPSVKCKYFGKNNNKRLKEIKSINTDKLGKQSIKYSCSFFTFKKNLKYDYLIVDDDVPNIALTGDSEIVLYINDTYEEQGATAVDNFDGDLTTRIVIDGTVDTSKEGEYEIRYIVEDSSKNTASISRRVKVVPRPVYSPKVSSTAGYLGCGTPGVIYLTFDDGPHGSYTPVILDVLKKYGVKATFFITASGPDNLVSREASEGHAVGIHSASHAYNKIYTSTTNFWSDFDIVEARIKNLTGKQPNLYRFPGGSSNTISKRFSVGIMSTLANEIHSRGYEYFDWNISSGDAGGTTNPNVEYSNVISSLSKSRGNVILMHDIKYHTSVAINDIVKFGLDNGYKFDVLTSDIICHQRINN